MITLAQIQERLAEEIKNSKMTQTELAKQLNIKQPQISCYIKGQKMPALDTLANLCKILDIDANYILCQDIKDTTKNTATKKHTEIHNSFNNSNNSGTFNF